MEGAELHNREPAFGSGIGLERQRRFIKE